MNFCLPIIVSDRVGCKDDLIRENRNGYIYKYSDSNDLSAKMELLIKNDALRNSLGSVSQKIIQSYSFLYIISALRKIIEGNT